MLKDIIGHDDIKNSLKILKNKLPNLILFTGPKGVGKKHTAINLIDEVYGGVFTHRLLTHPDILILESDTKIFKLELVNQMKDFISETAFELDKKFVILRDVDTMNKESANACLKIFEDSPKNTHFILLAENKELVIDTVCSRSISLKFSPIKDLKKYMPSLTPLEVKLMGGCIGNKNILDNIKVDNLYNSVTLLLNNYPETNYSKIIDWYLEHKDLDISLLNSMFLLVSQDFAKNNKLLNTSLFFINSCKEFKDKIPSNLKLDMHFKNMLIQNRNKLGNIKYPTIEKIEDKHEVSIIPDIIDQINNEDNPEIKTFNFEKYVNPHIDKFIKISFSDKELVQLNTFVDGIIKEKIKEKHYQVDDGSLRKRFYTGFLGEMAVSLIFEKNTVDWAIGNSKIFNKADLSSLGKDIGIKTVEWGKFPIIHKNPKRPEIINIRDGNSIYVCGIASVENMKNNSTDDLILSDQLRQRNVKTGFYGFDDLKYLPKERVIQKLNRETQ
jgi:hypothetical protein